jgi:hypothetical protein
LQNRKIILYFKQNDNEDVATAWERLQIMLRTSLSHGVNEWTILHSFYNDLNFMSMSMLDSAAGGAFMTKKIFEAKQFLKTCCKTLANGNTERAPTSARKVNSIEEVDFLTAKVDAIYSYISKHNIDNVRLQDLVENNIKNIDINYIRNFGNNGYNNNYNNAYAKPHMFLTSIQVVTMFLVI